MGRLPPTFQGQVVTMMSEAYESLLVDLRRVEASGGHPRIQRTVAAPEGWQLWGSVVPVGSPVRLDVEVSSGVEGVLVTGRADVPVVTECSRCLDPLAATIAVDLDQHYVQPGTDTNGNVVERPEAGEDDDQPRVEGDTIDLTPALRDAVLTGLPLMPLCREDCPGLCAECGKRLADDPGHRHETTDPRWAALAGLLDESDGREPGGR